MFQGWAVKFNDLFYENVGFNSIKCDLMSFFIFILCYEMGAPAPAPIAKQRMPSDEAIMRYMGVVAHVVC